MSNNGIVVFFRKKMNFMLIFNYDLPYIAKTMQI